MRQVSFTCKAHARAAIAAMAVKAVGGGANSAVRKAELEVLKGVPNDSLELEIKFQGGAVFDPAEWSASSV
jgi:hypothetical protein